MAYLLLLAGVAMAVTAAVRLAEKQKEPFDRALHSEVHKPLNHELVALFELQETVESALTELDEKNQVFQHLVTRLENQRQAVEFRLQQLERLIARTEAVLKNPVAKSSTEPGRVNREQVYDLVDKGMDVTDVATELHLGRGEVELILGLRK